MNDELNHEPISHQELFTRLEELAGTLSEQERSVLFDRLRLLLEEIQADSHDGAAAHIA